ncbi:hypothetical protein LshimejAT787_0103080 [Lyophyllum shimeji]|uniref:Uncharacterized protein n=1 Tax=Lyophyllum shimeji TaxID=47721 RepID=A0A9P3PD32_LYOSH|nr:hypothetical protein LshimejAT787_0103080 [Lyophyllum shimeji]
MRAKSSPGVTDHLHRSSTCLQTCFGPSTSTIIDRSRSPPEKDFCGTVVLTGLYGGDRAPGLRGCGVVPELHSPIYFPTRGVAVQGPPAVQMTILCRRTCYISAIRVHWRPGTQRQCMPASTTSPSRSRSSTPPTTLFRRFGRHIHANIIRQTCALQLGDTCCHCRGEQIQQTVGLVEDLERTRTSSSPPTITTHRTPIAAPEPRTLTMQDRKRKSNCFPVSCCLDLHRGGIFQLIVRFQQRPIIQDEVKIFADLLARSLCQHWGRWTSQAAVDPPWTARMPSVVTALPTGAVATLRWDTPLHRSL